MKRLLVIVVFTFWLQGCGLSKIIVPSKADPIDVHTDASCYAPCTEAAPQITADPDSAVIAAITVNEYRKQCEVRRQACAQALKRGVESGAIK